MTDTGGVFQAMMLDVLREPFERWLAGRGLALVPVPTDEGVPTFTTTPTDAWMPDDLKPMYDHGKGTVYCFRCKRSVKPGDSCGEKLCPWTPALVKREEAAP